MGVTTTQTNKPLNPRGNDQSPLAYNRAKLFSGKALDFDGVNDTLSTDYAPSSNIQTTAYWVKLDSLTTNYVLGGFVSSSDQFGLYYWGGNANKNFGFNTWNADSYGVTLPDFADDYFHVVAEYNFTDFTQSKIFVNGQELSISQTHGTTLQRTTASRTFKFDSPNSNQEVNAQINGVKVFEGSLTAAQVADLYNNPEKVVPTGVDNTALKLWLPMQEGAGTTAYDGSGNGNHGTISGATYTHGIGAPVSQTAVIDWNKGTNLAKSSGDVSTDSGQWSANQLGTTTANYAEAPDGSTTASKITPDATQNFSGVIQATTLTNGKTYTFSAYLRTESGSKTVNLLVLDGDSNFYNGNQSIDDTWQRYTNTFTVTGATGGGGLYITSFLNSTEFLVWGAQLVEGNEAGVYTPTLSTAQTSDVLLPQGLTSGRDITGVNLFENVRKQGALNLDGNSWAEVHDNASVDFADFTLECWVNLNELTGTWQEFFTKADSGSDRSFEMYVHQDETSFGGNVFGSGVTWNTSTIDTKVWYHIVMTFDDSTNAYKSYVNGVQNTSITLSETQNNTDAPIIIGAFYTKTDLNTHGQIAQPRIYNRALTAEEVERNYNAGKNTYTN